MLDVNENLTLIDVWFFMSIFLFDLWKFQNHDQIIIELELLTTFLFICVVKVILKTSLYANQSLLSNINSNANHKSFCV